MEKLVFDGENAILGRLGTVVCKELLKGNSVDIINSEKIIISGSKEHILGRLLERRNKGGTAMRGPYYPKIADRLVKRMLRGMLPWDRARGKQAWKRLRCYVGNPNNETAKKIEFQIPEKYMTIKQIIELVP